VSNFAVDRDKRPWTPADDTSQFRTNIRKQERLASFPDDTEEVTSGDGP